MSGNYADFRVDSDGVQVRTGPRDTLFHELGHRAEVKGIIHQPRQRNFVIHAEEDSTKGRGVRISISIPYEVAARMLTKALKLADAPK